jgi:excisionase family DNA binding protein
MNRPLTAAEVAARLGIDSSLVSRYCSQGRLRAEKPGRDWLIDPVSVEEFERERRRPGRPPVARGV